MLRYSILFVSLSCGPSWSVIPRGESPGALRAQRQRPRKAGSVRGGLDARGLPLSGPAALSSVALTPPELSLYRPRVFRPSLPPTHGRTQSRVSGLSPENSGALARGHSRSAGSGGPLRSAPSSRRSARAARPRKATSARAPGRARVPRGREERLPGAPRGSPGRRTTLLLWP